MEATDAQAAAGLFDVGDTAVRRTVGADEAPKVTGVDRLDSWQVEPGADTGLDGRPAANRDVDGQFCDPRVVEKALF
jgi:hypothetical protein